MNQISLLTGNLSNHCVRNNCQWCRTRREKAIALDLGCRFPSPANPGHLERPILYMDAPAGAWKMGNSDAVSAVQIWHMKRDARTKGHRMVRGAR